MQLREHSPCLLAIVIFRLSLQTKTGKQQAISVISQQRTTLRSNRNSCNVSDIHLVRRQLWWSLNLVYGALETQHGWTLTTLFLPMPLNRIIHAIYVFCILGCPRKTRMLHEIVFASKLSKLNLIFRKTN